MQVGSEETGRNARNEWRNRIFIPVHEPIPLRYSKHLRLAKRDEPQSEATRFFSFHGNYSLAARRRVITVVASSVWLSLLSSRQMLYVADVATGPPSPNYAGLSELVATRNALC
jgi:hypothetical protein